MGQLLQSMWYYEGTGINCIKNCSLMINHKSMRNLTIDDDKLRHRSKLWKQLGYAQRKGIKSFGAVLNIACQTPL